MKSALQLCTSCGTPESESSMGEDEIRFFSGRFTNEKIGNF